MMSEGGGCVAVSRTVPFCSRDKRNTPLRHDESSGERRPSIAAGRLPFYRKVSHKLSWTHHNVNMKLRAAARDCTTPKPCHRHAKTHLSSYT